MPRDPQLDKLISDLKTKKFRDGEAKGLTQSIGGELSKQLSPLFSEHSKMMTDKVGEAVMNAVKNLSVNVPKQDATQVSVNIPDVIVPDIKVPVPQVHYTPPSINIPSIKMPNSMGVTGWIGMLGYDSGFLKNPFPVQLRDKDGNPVSLGGSSTFGGGGPNVNIMGATATVGMVTINPDGIPTYTTGGSGSSSVSLINSDGNYYNGDNPFPINHAWTNGSVVVVGSGYQDNALRIVHATDAIVSINQVQWNGNAVTVGTGYQDNALRVVNATDAITSVRIDSSSASVAANIIDSSGVAYSGSNPVPITGTVIVGSSTNSTAASIIDSTGVAFEGSNPFPITIVTSATASVNVAITDSGGVQYSGSNPVPVTLGTRIDDANDSIGVLQVSGTIFSSETHLTARQTNPTAVSDGATSFASSDDLGRQITRPVQARDLILTAYATFATGTEATLFAASVATYADLIYILAANDSTVAVGIDIRPSTAGSIVMHLEIPANGVVGVSAPVPIPQQATGDGTGGTWTVDLPDITGTTVSVTGLFTQEI